MRRYAMFVAGMLMVGAGAYLIFANPRLFPLWFVWLAGPFLWYVGIAVTIGGLATALFLSPTREARGAEEQEEVPVLRFRTLAKRQPAGVLREIPAMGGFIL
ncbi:MAG TPA: hypothetical protein VEV41_06360 [Terriglobales bacterium]|jgi:hypothetical protein|nr:hypothetical protein [Terriglobales bacterium]